MSCKSNYIDCKFPNGCYIIGPTGPQGPAGVPGPTGPAPNLIVGSVTTGAPGTEASVEIIPIKDISKKNNG